MSTATFPTTRQRGAFRQQEAEVLSRLRTVTGLAGVTSMYEGGTEGKFAALVTAVGRYVRSR
jgi:hypothetical protein